MLSRGSINIHFGAVGPLCRRRGGSHRFGTVKPLCRQRGSSQLSGTTKPLLRKRVRQKGFSFIIFFHIAQPGSSHRRPASSRIRASLMYGGFNAGFYCVDVDFSLSVVFRLHTVAIEGGMMHLMSGKVPFLTRLMDQRQSRMD